MKIINFRNDILPLKDKLYRLALRITLNHAEAEDVVQETMMKVWNKRDTWAAIDSIEAFCLTTCRNIALDKLKRADNNNQTLDTAHGNEPADSSYTSNPEALMMQQEELGMTKGWYEDPSNWHSFNDFFARHLKSPDQRPIFSPEDDRVVTSPADCEPQGAWAIDEESYIITDEKIAVKSRVFNSIRNLIGPESPYCDDFAGGVFFHAFLNANDYHRYHFPMDGVIKELRVIPGDDALGGSITWEPALQQYVVDCSVPGWQSIETRGLAIIETAHFGLVAVMPIGMSQVASVNFEPDLQVGDKVKKGDMLGYFLFGGSDFVLVFQKEAAFKLLSPQKGDAYEHILMGELLGSVGEP